jgi:hypothetical protein
MFQFAGLAGPYLCIQYGLIRESQDQILFVRYPTLFADFHALHRLLMPRHPPYALSSLTTYIQSSPQPAPAEAFASQNKKLDQASKPLGQPTPDGASWPIQ